MIALHCELSSPFWVSNNLLILEEKLRKHNFSQSFTFERRSLYFLFLGRVVDVASHLTSDLFLNPRLLGQRRLPSPPPQENPRVLPAGHRCVFLHGFPGVFPLQRLLKGGGRTRWTHEAPWLETCRISKRMAGSVSEAVCSGRWMLTCWAVWFFSAPAPRNVWYGRAAVSREPVPAVRGFTGSQH